MGLMRFSVVSSMDKSHAQAIETRKRNTQARRERHERERAELEATINTLRQIRQNPKATPGERLEAIKLLMKLEGGVYGQY